MYYQTVCPKVYTWNFLAIFPVPHFVFYSRFIFRSSCHYCLLNCFTFLLIQTLLSRFFFSVDIFTSFFPSDSSSLTFTPLYFFLPLPFYFFFFAPPFLQPLHVLLPWTHPSRHIGFLNGVSRKEAPFAINLLKSSPTESAGHLLCPPTSGQEMDTTLNSRARQKEWGFF